MRLTRRHRAVTISLAAIAAGVFLVFVTRVSLVDAPPGEPRTCGASELYAGLSFTQVRQKYHWAMEQLVEERMNLYDGHTLLQCGEQAVEDVIPSGPFASSVASALPTVPDNFSSTDFVRLLTEFWRMYDCHLLTREGDASFFTDTKDTEGSFLIRENWSQGAGITIFSQDPLQHLVPTERIRARVTLDRLLSVLRASEHYLPLHAASRCLQRGAVDVRNAVALLSDANQCAPTRLSEPETSLLRP